MVNVYKVLLQNKNLNVLLANLDALAETKEGGIGGDTCPNGGQNTRGEAKNEKWKETHTTDKSGKVTVNGKTFDFGAEYKDQSVTLYCYSVECPGSKGSCILCNVWCNK